MYTKLTLTVFFAFVLYTQDILAQLYVGNPISVTNLDASYGKKSPKIAINGQGQPVVFWVRTGANEAFFVSIKDENGFSTPIEVPLNGVNPNIWSGNLGPNLAVFGSHLYISFEKYGEAIYIVHSPDNGLTWEEPVAAFTPPAGRKATIPNLAVDNQGNVYVIYINTNNQESDAHYGLVKSTDQGVSFSEETNVNGLALGSEVCECCNGDITIANNGEVYITFRNNDNNLRDIWVARSTDGGVTFTAAYDVDQTDWVLNACPSNGPSILATDNYVYAVYFSAASDWDNGVYFSALDASNEVISPSTIVPSVEGLVGSQNAPCIAGSGDTLIIAVDDYYNSSKNITLLASTTGLAGLTTSSIAYNGNGNQSKPQIAYRNGIFYLVYQDDETDTVLYQELSFGTTDIQDAVAPRFSIFPNPASNTIHWNNNFEGESVVRIINQSGKIMKTKIVNSRNNVLEIDNLSPGLYTFIVQAKGNIFSERFVVAEK